MASKFNPLNIDESKIVKKEQPVPEPVVENKPQPQEEIIIKQPETKQNEEITNQPIEELPGENLDKRAQNYLNIVKEYSDINRNIIRDKLPNRKTELKEILNETYKKPEIPVYVYDKNPQDGNLIIKSKNASEEKLEVTKKEFIKLEDSVKNELLEMIDMTNKNIIRTKIELKVHIELLQNTVDQNQRNLYESKIKAFKNDLDYFNQRKSILEKMYNSGKEQQQ